MATSSIFRNFVIEGDEQVEQFANAIEQAYRQRNDIKSTVDYIELHGREMDDFMDKVAKKYNGQIYSNKP